MNGIEKLITPYIYELMTEGNDIMLFPDNKQIIVNEEIDEWYDIHGFEDETKRIMFVNVIEGYAIDSWGMMCDITDILIAMQDIQKGYDYLTNLPFESTGNFNNHWWEI